MARINWVNIPAVLEEMTIRGEVPIGIEWGCCAQSHEVYENFSAKWQERNPSTPVPSQARMEQVWVEINIPPKSDNEIETELDTWLSNSTNMKQLLVKYFKQKVKEDPDFLKRIGITIS